MSFNICPVRQLADVLKISLLPPAGGFRAYKLILLIARQKPAKRKIFLIIVSFNKIYIIIYLDFGKIIA
jgi:hypothetical protein